MVTNTMAKNIVEVKALRKSFKKEAGQDLLVLDGINFNLQEGEIVALLGRSGSGKSTLLRFIAGLIEPTPGQVSFYNEKITRPVPGIAMVFQSFALLPWLTVLQNVELGLEAQGVAKKIRRQRALKAIDMIGLDGFESAFPKELSGGMLQRVGFARAVVVNPTLLLMDEPFSALDVLTAENLRSDLLDIWEAGKTNTKGILFVTHNIEEAVKLADRIFIFDSDPGCIKSMLSVNLPHPRHDQDEAFRKLVDDIYTTMTSTKPKGAPITREAEKVVDVWYRLPDVSVSELLGMLETINDEEYQGQIDLPELTEILHLDVDDLLPIIEILEIFKLVAITGRDVSLTEAGKNLADADLLEAKKLFATKLRTHIPLIKHIRDVLDSEPDHQCTQDRFLETLETALSDSEAQRVLTVAIDWGRYAELFAFDATSNLFNLENPQ